MSIANLAPTSIRLTPTIGVGNAAAAVAENATGAVIGTLTTLDPNAGDTFTYSVSDSRFEVAAGGILKLKGGVALNYEVQRFLNITVTATDQDGLSRAQAFGIAVTNVNEAPTAIRLSGTSVAENAAGTAIGTVTVVDPDAGDTHSVTVSDARFEVAGGVLRLKAGQALDFEAASTVALTVTATDQGGLARSQAFRLRVTDANDAPIAQAQSGAATEDAAASSATGNLLAGATDPDGRPAWNTLSVAAVNGSAATSLQGSYGTLSWSSSGGYIYTLDNVRPATNALAAGQVMTEVFSVTVTDGSLTDSKPLTMTIIGANDAPLVTSATTASFAENGTSTAYQATGSDPEGAAVTWSLSGTDAALFNINVATGAVSFKAAPDFEVPADAGANNVYDITVTASDGALTASQAVAISVSDILDTINLDAVALGTGGFKITGETASDNLVTDYALTTIGDLNGDGRPEILVGAYASDAGGSNAGAAYVVWGKADGTAIDLDAVALGTGGFKIIGENGSDFLARYATLTAIGDLNGDGRPEILVGAYNNDAGGADAGAAYVVWGKADGTAVDLDAVALGTGGFKITGENAGDVLSQYGLTPIGDLNGDELPEILVGASGNDAGGTDAGAAYVIWGKADGTAVNLDAVAAGTGGFRIYGENTSDTLSQNYALTPIGDLNGDGRPEILVGAYGNDAGGSNAGAAYVVWGKADGTAVNLDSIAVGTGGFRIYGENAFDYLSQYALTTIGDLNGDGRPEILVGAWTNDAGGSNAGAAYVVWGKATGMAVNLDAVAAGTGGFKIIAENSYDSLSTSSLTSIGDLNGDGLPEILVGGPTDDAGGTNAGAAYVVWGKADGTAVNLDAVALGTGGFKIIGENGSDFLAEFALTSIGDLNGDGKAEILVGARTNDAGGSDAGAAYVVWGKATGTAVNLDNVALGTGGFRIIGENAGDNLSQYALTSIGDLNGDGRPEILVGAYNNDAGGSNAGAAYIVYSRFDWIGGA